METFFVILHFDLILKFKSYYVVWKLDFIFLKFQKNNNV